MNANGIIEKTRNLVESHRVDEGAYRRWSWESPNEKRTLNVNEYGCADAANILYTIGEFIREPEKRAAWIQVLQGQQHPDDGLYAEGTHHPFHSTAHCIAALELFDAQPLLPPKALLQYTVKENLYRFLDGLDWENNPWSQSHQGAGLYAALKITGNASPEWEKNYFDYLYTHADPETGLGLKGRHGQAPLCHQLYGWFHYCFNFNHAHMPIPYPEKLIDSCISMYRENGLTDRFGREVGFMEIDWVFAMNRASRQTSHRFDEVKQLLLDFAKKFLAYLDSLDEKTDEGLNDLHMLFGAICAVAELQLALPGEIQTKVPLKNVLDRRPFI